MTCDHFQVLITNLLRRHWEWQEFGMCKPPGALEHNTISVGSLDVKTAFDVARPRIVEKILTACGEHGDTIAAILYEMMNVEGAAQIGTLDLQKTGSVVFWGQIVKYALEMSELGEELRKMGMEPKQESLW